jgi:hypothetical protein
MLTELQDNFDATVHQKKYTHNNMPPSKNKHDIKLKPFKAVKLWFLLSTNDDSSQHTIIEKTFKFKL